MPDDPKKRGPADRKRINIHQAHEVRYWSEALKCTPLELVLAAKFAGEDGVASSAEVREVLGIARRELHLTMHIEQARSKRRAKWAARKAARK